MKLHIWKYESYIFGKLILQYKFCFIYTLAKQKAFIIFCNNTSHTAMAVTTRNVIQNVEKFVIRNPKYLKKINKLISAFVYTLLCVVCHLRGKYNNN